MGCDAPSSMHWSGAMRHQACASMILCRRRSGGTAHEGGECDQSIGSTVSDAIARSWLSTLLRVVDN